MTKLEQLLAEIEKDVEAMAHFSYEDAGTLLAVISKLKSELGDFAPLQELERIESELTKLLEGKE